MNKRKVIIILVIVLLMAGVGFFYFFSRNKKDDRDNSFELEQMKKNQDYEAIKRANTEKNVEYCFSLESKRIDECINGVAKSANDASICDKISGDLKDDCKESILYEEIVSGDDMERCSELKIAGIYSQCITSFFWKWDDLEKCSIAEEKDRGDCIDIINKKIAYQNNDESKCNDVNNEDLKDDCFTVIKSKPKDSDNDGILDGDEISYGINPYSIDTDKDGVNDLDELKNYFTNPNKADTDNDGFSDGDEIKNGYNPKGDGKL